MSPIAIDSLSIDASVSPLKKASRPTDTQSKLDALTLEEKVSLLSGRSFCDTPDVQRLGIASLKTSDGPSGKLFSLICQAELTIGWLRVLARFRSSVDDN